MPILAPELPPAPTRCVHTPRPNTTLSLQHTTQLHTPGWFPFTWFPLRVPASCSALPRFCSNTTYSMKSFFHKPPRKKVLSSVLPQPFPSTSTPAFCSKPEVWRTDTAFLSVSRTVPSVELGRSCTQKLSVESTYVS